MDDQRHTSSEEQVTATPEAPSYDEEKLLSKDELLSLISPKKQNKKPLVITGALTLLVVLGSVWWYQSNNAKTASQSVSSLRRYTVARGDVIVGSNESSSISLSRESVTFPVSSTVEEVFVKSGSSVKEGDPLMRLNIDDITAGMVSYELQLKMAKLELDQAKLDQQSKLVKARQTYDAAVLQGEISSTNQTLSVQQLETSLASAEKSLSDALEKLYTYRNYEKNYDDDYSDLTYYTKVYKDYQSTYESLQKSYNRAQELENSLIPGAKENYEISKNKDIEDGRDEDKPSSSTTYW